MTTTSTPTTATRPPAPTLITNNNLDDNDDKWQRKFELTRKANPIEIHLKCHWGTRIAYSRAEYRLENQWNYVPNLSWNLGNCYWSSDFGNTLKYALIKVIQKLLFFSDGVPDFEFVWHFVGCKLMTDDASVRQDSLKHCLIMLPV